MKQRLVFLTILFLISLLQSCSPKSSSIQQTKDITVIIPWYNGNNNYEVRAVHLKTVESLDPFKGSAADIIWDPYYDYTQTPRWENFTLNLSKNSSGEFIPQDLKTSQTLTVYAHFERIKEFQDSLGIGHLSSWPRTVILNPNKLLSKSMSLHNNASYIPKADLIFIYPYDLPNIPLSFNGGALIHEQFHSFFDHFLPNFSDLIDLNKKYSNSYKSGEDYLLFRIYNYLFLSGLNEGIADFLMWVYEGNEESFSHSFGKMKNKERNIKMKLPNLTIYNDPWLFAQSKSIEKEIKENNPLNSEIIIDFKTHQKMAEIFYSFGHEFATLCRYLSEVLKPNSRDGGRVLFKAIIKNLPTLAHNFNSLSTADYLSPNDFLKILIKALLKDLPIEMNNPCSALKKKLITQDKWNNIFEQFCSNTNVLQYSNAIQK